MSRGPRVAAAGLAAVLLVLGACGRQETVPANRFESRVAGFRLALPDAWVGHYRAIEAAGQTASVRRPKALFLVEFLYLPADSMAAAQRLLDITVYDSGDWIAQSAEPGPPSGQVVAERDGRVWVAALPQANPFTGGPDSTRFAAMLLDLEAVKREFSLP
jgi:hypothetical protein